MPPVRHFALALHHYPISAGSWLFASCIVQRASRRLPATVLPAYCVRRTTFFLTTTYRSYSRASTSVSARHVPRCLSGRSSLTMQNFSLRLSPSSYLIFHAWSFLRYPPHTNFSPPVFELFFGYKCAVFAVLNYYTYRTAVPYIFVDHRSLLLHIPRSHYSSFSTCNLLPFLFKHFFSSRRAMSCLRVVMYIGYFSIQNISLTSAFPALACSLHRHADTDWCGSRLRA